MGLFGFLNKKSKEEIVQTKIEFEDVKEFISKKENDFESKEKHILDKIFDKIREFDSKIKDNLHILKKVDVDSKKANDKEKSVVKEGLGAYINSVETFLRRMNKIDKSNFEEVNAKINKLFFDFEKGTKLSYAKATYLIGKEMANVKNDIKLLSKGLLKIFEEDNIILENLRKVKEIKNKKEQIETHTKSIKENKETIESLKKKITKTKENQIEALQKLENFKKTKEYEEIKTKQQNFQQDKETIKKYLINLRNSIDFKKLGNVFHLVEKKMEIVKDYRDEFSASFEKHTGKDLVKLLEEAQMFTNDIKEQITQVKNQMEELEKDRELIRKDKSKDLTEDVDRINYELDSLNQELERQSTKISKLEAKKQELKDEILEGIEKINN